MSDFVRALLALPQPASTVARAVDNLHFFVIAMTMLGATFVFVVAVVFVVRYRRRADELTPVIEMPLRLEMLWIGSLLVLFIAFWLIGYRIFLRMSEPPEDAMEVYVTGKQWMWKFSHPDGRSSISVLTVPAGKPVRLTMTSRDVIHSFAVPDFRIKQDVLPGRYTTAWFEAVAPGTYQILCTEYCGTGHSNMWGSVVALSPEDYDAWLDGAEPLAAERAEEGTLAERPNAIDPSYSPERRAFEAGSSERSMAVRGEEVAVRHACLACHTVDGRNHIGPTWLGLFGAERVLEGGGRALADPSYLTESMMDPRARLVAGYPAVMPSYRGLLTGPETAMLVEYIRSLREPRSRRDQTENPPLDDLLAPVRRAAGS